MSGLTKTAGNFGQFRRVQNDMDVTSDERFDGLGQCLK